MGEELLDLFACYLQIVATRGRSLTWSYAFPKRDNYRAAAYRLRKQGLVISERRGQHSVAIAVSQDTDDRLSPVHRPDRFWRRKWNGFWYLLVYDVPEKDRRYRDELRRFLTRKRMGCLQKSVWVSPYDIRPAYADLVEAAAVDRYAHLFQSRTVLGSDPQSVVLSSWNMDGLREAHAWFIRICGRNLESVRMGDLGRGALETMAREEMTAYVTVMQGDPLLPESLHPASYLGREAFAVHCKLVHEIAKRL